jgi:hypothetical protein
MLGFRLPVIMLDVCLCIVGIMIKIWHSLVQGIVLFYICGLHKYIACEFPLGSTDSSPHIMVCVLLCTKMWPLIACALHSKPVFDSWHFIVIVMA